MVQETAKAVENQLPGSRTKARKHDVPKARKPARTPDTHSGEHKMNINGFEFTSRLLGTANCYHVAKRGDLVYTSKSMAYLRRKVESIPPIGTSEFKNGKWTPQ